MRMGTVRRVKTATDEVENVPGINVGNNELQ